MPQEYDLLYWNNFLALEKKLIDSFYFIHLDEDNFNAYSLCYRSIILEACSDLEYVSKLLFKLSVRSNKVNIKTILDKIDGDHADFRNIEVKMHSLHSGIKPWIKDHEEEGAPSFWKTYNEIKHHGSIKAATLKSTIETLAALFSILLAYYKTNMGGNLKQLFETNEPSFFDFPNLRPTLLTISQSCKINLPGFENC